MKYSQRWRQTTIANRMLVVSSVLLTFVTAGLVGVGILQYYASKNQLGLMRGMIDQNERLIKASSDQANASAKSANIAEGQIGAVRDSAQAAKDSASAAKTVTEQNKELIKAAQTQAHTSQASVEIARQALLPKIAFSAELLAPPTAGQQIDFRLDILNGGGSQAVVVVNMRAAAVDQPPDDCSGGAQFGPIAVLPNGQGFARATFSVSDPQIKAIQDGQIFLFVCGKGTQKGLGGTIPLNFCYVWNKGFNTMGQCSDFSFMKKRK